MRAKYYSSNKNSSEYDKFSCYKAIDSEPHLNDSTRKDEVWLNSLYRWRSHKVKREEERTDEIDKFLINVISKKFKISKTDAAKLANSLIDEMEKSSTKGLMSYKEKEQILLAILKTANTLSKQSKKLVTG